jgi:ferritin-like metal-binding protein YciE
MEKLSLYDFFLDMLRDLFSGETLIVENMSKIIPSVSHHKLKNALTEHLEESKTHLQRLQQIFKILNENPTGKKCMVIQDLFNEIDGELKKETSPAIKDVSLIIYCQKIEHYEITSYGSARAIARHLQGAGINDQIDFDEIADFLQQCLDEESAADENLTDIAEGGFFTPGINDEAEEQAAAIRQPQKDK